MKQVARCNRTAPSFIFLFRSIIIIIMRLLHVPQKYYSIESSLSFDFDFNFSQIDDLPESLMARKLVELNKH